MIYRVYSYHLIDSNTLSAINSWERDGIINIPVPDNDLHRSIDGLPFLKDIIQKAVDKCQYNDDIIIYTNSDIGLVSNEVNFPIGQFFSARKQVEKSGIYSTEDLKNIGYEHSVNCDLFGFTKEWYLSNKDNIPDFVIGSPRWDIAMLLLLNGKKINNICYHVRHDSEWKNDFSNEKHSWNRSLFKIFKQKNNLEFDNFNQCPALINYMAKNLSYDHLANPKIIIFYTPSHENLYRLQINSLQTIYGDSIIIKSIKHDTQYCLSANYHESGWRTTQINKVGSLINELDTFKENEQFIFCDADIMHFNNFLPEITTLLEEYEFVAQKSFSDNNHPICSGFFAARKTPSVMLFLRTVLSELMYNDKEELYGDQYYFNMYYSMLKYSILDNKYFSPGAITGKKIESKEQIDQLIKQTPNNIKIAHASWIYGKDNKEYYLSNIIK